ncbi:MAG: three-Cys-motif partner protein TcmP [Acidisphaera sp.]|nr:three-Cys-motif partner protein TcmP [Acidisphaera sp.]
MRKPSTNDPYVGREQTAAKHFILRRYLQTLAFKLLQGPHSALTYVDGFSGPWESKTKDFADTSFMIAIAVLKDANQRLRQNTIHREIRCFFVEENARAYRQLRDVVMAHHDPENGFHVATFQGRFEDAMTDIMTFIGNSFALTFIDPTGWTGYGFDKIAPILRHHPGEVLVNYMFDHISRFAGWGNPKNSASFNAILGGQDWKQRLDNSLPMSDAMEKLFCEQFRAAGTFKYVLSTRIAKLADRPHFSIAYGTRSPAGLRAFREIEYSALRDHDVRRSQAKMAISHQKTGQPDMFAAADLMLPNSMDTIVAAQRLLAKPWLAAYLREHSRAAKFSEIWEVVLPAFVLRVTDVKDICVELAKEGLIKAPWREEVPRKHKPSDHHVIELHRGV